MGEETDGVIESVSKLQAKVKAISGVNILTDAGSYKSTYEINTMSPYREICMLCA